MEIERLYTSNQFRKYLETIITDDTGRWKYMVRYLDLIEGGLKKEMFVNELEKPSIYEIWKMHIPKTQAEMSMNRECLAWQEAEKKVIFKGHPHRYANNVFVCNIQSTVLNIPFKKYPTLYNLAEATNGQLETKNITL